MLRLPAAFTSLSHVSVVALLPIAFIVVKGYVSDSKVHTEIMNEVPVSEPATITLVASGSAEDVLSEIKSEFALDFPNVNLYIMTANSSEDAASLTAVSDGTAYTTEGAGGQASNDLEIAYSPESAEDVQILIKWLTSEHGRAVLSDLNVTRLNVTVRD
jgi:hypothetical protein